MYTVYGGVRSRAMRVIWMLEELGVPFTHIAAAPRSDEVRALNPTGKVPVLVDDGEAIIDSTAILTYLADKHGALTAPAGTLARARQDALTQFALDELDAVLWTAARHTFILPEDKRLPGIKDSLKWEFDRSQIVLADRMGPEFVAGDQFTIADIVTAHCFNWATAAGFPVTEEMAAYAHRMRERDAFKRALARQPA